MTLPALSNEDRAYVAGFFDGEGSLTIARFGKLRKTYWLMVCLTNKNLAVLTWIQSLYGGRLQEKPRLRPERWARAFTLTINRKADSKAFLESVQPFVRIKRQQVEHALAFLSLPPRRWRYVRRPGSWPLKITVDDDATTRESMKLRMNELNQRGPERVQ